MTKPNKAKEKKRTGPPSLAPDEPTKRFTVNVPESVYFKALMRADEDGLSAYARDLIEADLKSRKAS